METQHKRVTKAQRMTPERRSMHAKKASKGGGGGSGKESFLGNYMHSLEKQTSEHVNEDLLCLQPNLSNGRRQLTKLDLAYRLSNLAMVESQNRSMQDEMYHDQTDSQMRVLSQIVDQSTMMSSEAHPALFSHHQSVRHSQAAARTVEPRDESDESKVTITQSSAAERRKTKRETLANYLKTSEKPKMSITQASALGRNSKNISRGGAHEIQRQSSKTSLTSQQSGKKRRTGSTLGTSKTPSSTLKNSTSAGKQIRRLGRPNGASSASRSGQLSSSIEMVRSGGSKLTATRNSKLKTSLDPGSLLKSSQSPMAHNAIPTCLLAEQGQKSPKQRSDEDHDDDSETPRQMHLDVFQSKNHSVAYDSEYQKILNQTAIFQRQNGDQNGSQSTANQRSRAFSFAKVGSSANPGKQTAALKHKNVALSLVKKADMSTDLDIQKNSDKSEDQLIQCKHRSNKSSDQCQPDQPVPIQPTLPMDQGRSVFQTITNSSRYMNKDRSIGENYQSQNSASHSLTKQSKPKTTLTSTIVSSDTKQERRKKHERRQQAETLQPPKEISNFNTLNSSSQQAPAPQSVTMSRSNRQPSIQNNCKEGQTLAKQGSGTFLPQSSMSNLPVSRSPQKNTQAAQGDRSGKLSTRNADAVKFCFQPIKDSMDKALLDEIKQLRQANGEIEAKYARFTNDLQNENQALQQELSILTQNAEERKAKEAAEFKSNCADWQRTVDDLGRFTIDGSSTVNSQSELSSILKAQAQKFAVQETAMIEATSSFEEALAQKDETVQCLDKALKAKLEQVKALESENLQLKDKVCSLTHHLDDKTIQVDSLSSECKAMESKVKATSVFKSMLKGLKNELEQQQGAFDEQIVLFRAKEKEFEELKCHVSQQLKALAQRDAHIDTMRTEIASKTSQLMDVSQKFTCKLTLKFNFVYSEANDYFWGTCPVFILQLSKRVICN